MGGKVVVFEPDLLFLSRIESAGRKAGLDLKVVTKVNELQQALKESAPRILLVNLDALGGGGNALTGLVHGTSRLIGYYSHANSKLAKEALVDGFDMVIPRRAFADRLGEVFGDAGSSREFSHLS
jgi:hypothetical protein